MVQNPLQCNKQSINRLFAKDENPLINTYFKNPNTKRSLLCSKKETPKVRVYEHSDQNQ